MNAHAPETLPNTSSPQNENSEGFITRSGNWLVGTNVGRAVIVVALAAVAGGIGGGFYANRSTGGKGSEARVARGSRPGTASSDTNKLLKYLPVSRHDFTIGYGTPLNQPHTELISVNSLTKPVARGNEEALAWLKAHGYDPKTHKSDIVYPFEHDK